MASSKIIRPSFSMFFSHVLGHGCAGCGIMFHDIGFLLYTSICARKTSNTYNYFYTCLQASQSCDALQSTDPQAYHAKRSKDSHTHTQEISNVGAGVLLLSRPFPIAASGEIEPMFTARPLKLSFRRNCEDGMGDRSDQIRRTSRTFL